MLGALAASAAQSGTEFGLGMLADKREAKRQYRYNQMLMQEQHAYSERMFKNRYQYAVQDLKAAGLNPILAAGVNPSAPQGASASVQRGNKQVSGVKLIEMSNAMQTGRVLKAQERLLKAQERKEVETAAKTQYEAMIKANEWVRDYRVQDFRNKGDYYKYMSPIKAIKDDLGASVGSVMELLKAAKGLGR